MKTKPNQKKKIQSHHLAPTLSSIFMSSRDTFPQPYETIFKTQTNSEKKEKRKNMWETLKPAEAETSNKKGAVAKKMVRVKWVWGNTRVHRKEEGVGPKCHVKAEVGDQIKRWRVGYRIE